MPSRVVIILSNEREKHPRVDVAFVQNGCSAEEEGRGTGKCPWDARRAARRGRRARTEREYERERKREKRAWEEREVREREKRGRERASGRGIGDGRRGEEEEEEEGEREEKEEGRQECMGQRVQRSCCTHFAWLEGSLSRAKAAGAPPHWTNCATFMLASTHFRRVLLLAMHVCLPPRARALCART